MAGLRVKGTQANREQQSNIGLLCKIGTEMGAKPDELAGAHATMTQESGCMNLRGGDRDSAGLFQQRPSCGWGSFAQVTDPNYSIRKFMTPYLGYCRKGMDPIAASHAVQRSAYASAPAKWMPESRSNVGIVMGSGDFGDVTFGGSGGSETRILPYEFSRGSPDKRETSWEAMGRLGEEVAWDRFMRGGVLWFVSEEWLARQQARFAFSENARGVLSIDFDNDSRRRAEEARVQALTYRWSVQPGDLVVVSGEGPGDGEWLVKEIRRDAYALTTEITLKRPAGKKNEPAPQTETKTTSVGGMPGMDSGVGIGGGATGGTAKAQEIYNAAEAATAMNWTYSQPSRNNQRQGGSADCSSGVSWVLAQAGISLPGPLRPNAPVSGSYMGWGQAGPGQNVTVWANAGHIWMSFRGCGPKVRFDTSSYGDAYTGSSGGRLRSTNRPSGGFVARHWPGT